MLQDVAKPIEICRIRGERLPLTANVRDGFLFRPWSSPFSFQT
ncbi:hypothetical protein NK6_2866 [Bradyrhizobium diazoefficiens]|uniref:Uncharacterized protein n=1 Tax=Bradyrhizobium diazoefficiens TaxID=1355477 RepID=A0A0E4BMN4_9BRAD|nr:hypothetical protein NK6_2866 [Bradyrhizobium diazoefficiens]